MRDDILILDTYRNFLRGSISKEQAAEEIDNSLKVSNGIRTVESWSKSKWRLSKRP